MTPIRVDGAVVEPVTLAEMRGVPAPRPRRRRGRGRPGRSPDRGRPRQVEVGDPAHPGAGPLPADAHRLARRRLVPLPLSPLVGRGAGRASSTRRWQRHRLAAGLVRLGADRIEAPGLVIDPAVPALDRRAALIEVEAGYGGAGPPLPPALAQAIRLLVAARLRASRRRARRRASRRRPSPPWSRRCGGCASSASSRRSPPCPSPSPLPIGARRRRFVLERPVETPDGFGGVLRRYVAGPLLWGAIEPLGAVERLRGGRAEAVATHRVRLALRRRRSRRRCASPPARAASRSARPAIRTGAGRDLVCEVEELTSRTGDRGRRMSLAPVPPTSPLLALRAAILRLPRHRRRPGAADGRRVRLTTSRRAASRPVYALFGDAEIRDDSVDGARRHRHALALMVFARPGSLRSARGGRRAHRRPPARRAARPRGPRPGAPASRRPSRRGATRAAARPAPP